MQILCVLTNSHKILFNNHFLKTIPCPENVIVKELNIEGDGSYKTKSWQKAVNTKTEFVISYIKSVENNTLFVFCDVDIQFFPSFNINILKNELIDSKKDILFQKETSRKNDLRINSGFYVAKSSMRLLVFFEKVLEALEKSKIKSDQICINDLLKNSSISWGFLPFNYYARTHSVPLPDLIYCHHANKAGKINDKINQFKLIRKYYESSCLGKGLIILTIIIQDISLKLIKTLNKRLIM